MGKTVFIAGAYGTGKSKNLKPKTYIMSISLGGNLYGKHYYRYNQQTDGYGAA